MLNFAESSLGSRTAVGNANQQVITVSANRGPTTFTGLVDHFTGCAPPLAPRDKQHDYDWCSFLIRMATTWP